MTLELPAKIVKDPSCQLNWEKLTQAGVVAGAAVVNPTDGMAPVYEASDGLLHGGKLPTPIYQSDLASDFFVVSPALLTFQQGSFTPKADTVLVSVTMGASLIGTSGSPVVMLYKQGGTAGALNSNQQGVLLSGVTQKVIGTPSGNSWGSPVQREILLTGLTPGTSVAWELATGITGGFYFYPLSETPLSADCSQNSPAAFADAGIYDFIVVVRGATLAQLMRYSTYTNSMEPMARVSLPSGSGGVAISADGLWSAVCNNTDHSVTAINTDTGLGTNYSVPAGAAPQQVTIPSGYIAYLTTDNGKLHMLNLVTGAWNATGGFPVDLGGTTAPKYLQGWSTYVLIACPGTDEVVQVKLSDGSITHRYSVSNIKSVSTATSGTSGNTVFASADDPTNGWTVYPLNANALTIGASFVPEPPGWSSATAFRPVRGRVFTDGRTILMACSNSTGSRQICQAKAPGGPGITNWRNNAQDGTTIVPPTDLALSGYGDIFITSTNGLNVFPGGLFQCRALTGGAFFPEHSTVTVTGAS